MSESSFKQKCYALLCKVPEGSVTTYQELAHALGSKAYRAVGTAMATNPNAPQVPCHRVVRSDGSLGGYQGGLDKKIAILKREGVEVEAGRVRDFSGRLHKFN